VVYYRNEKKDVIERAITQRRIAVRVVQDSYASCIAKLLGQEIAAGLRHFRNRRGAARPNDRLCEYAVTGADLKDLACPLAGNDLSDSVGDHLTNDDVERQVSEVRTADDVIMAFAVRQLL